MMKRVLALGTILCLITWFAGCSLFKGSAKGVHEPTAEFFETLRSNIREVVSNPDKADDLLLIVDDMDEELLALDAVTRRHFDQLAALDADFEATEDEFHRAFAEFNEEVGKTRERLLEQRFLMRELATPEEWETLSDLDATLLESWQREPTGP